MLIYGLVDPRSLEIRYVGVTSRGLRMRLREHIRKAISHPELNTHKSNWIRSLLADGLQPRIEPLFVSEESCWEADEINWIAKLRAMGYRLTNLRAGGGSGRLPPDVRRRIAESLQGHGFSDATRAKISSSVKARWNDPVYRKNQEVSRGLEYRKVLSQRASDSWSDPSIRASRIAGVKANWMKPGRRDKQVQVAREWWTRDRRNSFSENNPMHNADTQKKWEKSMSVKKPCKLGCGFEGTPSELGAHIRWHCPNRLYSKGGTK